MNTKDIPKMTNVKLDDFPSLREVFSKCSKCCGRTLFLARCASRFLNYYETIVSCLSMM